MQFIYAALLLTLLPAQPREFVHVDWSQAVPADPEIAELRGEYASAVNARDVLRIAAVYTPDAITACNGSLLRGALAVAGRVARQTPAHASVTLTPRQFTMSATVASETGIFTETLADLDGNASVEGIYVTIYSRLPDGQWRIALEVRTTGQKPALAVW
jgi:ketosteroid isomerase-like protein